MTALALGILDTGLYVFAPVQTMKIYETYSTFQECERQAIGRRFLMSYRAGGRRLGMRAEAGRATTRA